MGSIDIDPTLNLVALILVLTLLIACGQLLIHIVKGCFRWYKNLSGTSDVDEETGSLSLVNEESMLERMGRYLIPFFRYTLTLVFIFFLVFAILRNYYIFTFQVNDFDRYLNNLEQILVAQMVAFGMVGLYWFYANQQLRKIIVWGLFILVLDVIVETLFHFYNLPIWHWVQLVEVALTGLVLLVLPLSALILFWYINRYCLSRNP